MCFGAELNDRKKKEQYLTNWLDGYKLAGECVPYIEKWKEQTQWEIDALSNAPCDSDEIEKGEMLDVFQLDSEQLQRALPMIPEYDLDKISSTDGSTTTSASYVYSFVMNVGDAPKVGYKEYSEVYTTKYQNIQRKYNTLEDIDCRLQELGFSGTYERLETAYHTFSLYKAGTVKKSAAAMEIRTYLDGLKGDLFQQVRKWENENMTWEEMANRVANRDETSDKFKIMQLQGEIRRKIISKLSDIGKNRESSSLIKLEDVWSQTLDHSYSILKLL